MEITIGRQLNLKLLEQAVDVKYNVPHGEIAAKVLNIRKARQAQMLLNQDNLDRRAIQYQRDPKNSKILTLMIDDAGKLPSDLMDGNYKISIKFEKK